jgi:hypothetical protein
VVSADLLPGRPYRTTPYLYSDADIAALMAVAATLDTPHQAATYETLIGLLAVSGIRSARRSASTAPTSTLRRDC